MPFADDDSSHDAVWAHLARVLDDHSLRFNGLRIDHAQGYLGSWTRARDSSDPWTMISRGSRLFEAMIARCRSSGMKVQVEDLGIVPQSFRQLIQDLGIARTNVFLPDWFDYSGPTETKNQLYSNEMQGSVCYIESHDEFPLAAYLTHFDIEIKRGLGRIKESEVSAAREVRRERVHDLLNWVECPQLQRTKYDAVLIHLIRALKDSPAEYLALSIQDLTGSPWATNVGGTTKPAYPNWTWNPGREELLKGGTVEALRSGQMQRILKEGWYD